MESPLIISFYADPPGETWYSESATVFRQRCREMGLECDVRKLDASPSWLENTRKKAKFVYDAMFRHQRDLLWIDIDTVLVQKPVYAWNRNADFAAVQFKGVSRLEPPLKIRSTAMWFNYTPLAMELLQKWVERCETGRYGDHREISNLLYEFPVVLDYMPDSYAHEKQQHDSVMVMGMADPVASRKKEMGEIANEIAQGR
jgi:hypothetical protein